MKTIKSLLLGVSIFTMASCGEKKVDSSLAENFRKEYESLSVIQKSIEQEQSEFFAEKDTLVENLRKVKGAMDGSVEDFNEGYREFLEHQDEIATQHNNVLGEIAQLEDRVRNGEITSKEAGKESIRLIENQKTVLSNYKNSLGKRDKLLKQYQELVEKKASLVD
jgi:peptidoglycan hydrolase CwlO-like protein